MRLEPPFTVERMEQFCAELRGMGCGDMTELVYAGVSIENPHGVIEAAVRER